MIKIAFDWPKKCRISILFLGLQLTFGWEVVKAHFAEAFRKYFASNDMDVKIRNLKRGMDKISCEYIDKFMELSKFWDRPYWGQTWCKYDVKLRQEMEGRSFQQPLAPLVYIDPFSDTSIYGLKDLPREILNKINGKDIIDAGGYLGDTAGIFNKYFPNSKIYVFEPISAFVSKINMLIKKGLLKNIIPVQKGLGEREEKINISFGGEVELADVTTLDSFVEKDHEVGLIKIDTEGFESKIIAGARELIKSQKPVLAVAIYHNPEDFFELKDKVQNLRSDYKFMIRRSENSDPTIDLVLIAW